MDLDAAGNVYVAGFFEHGDVRSAAPFTWTSIVAKVDASGAVAWRHDRDFEKARAISVDANGGVTVAARSQSEGTSNDLDVQQYASDGTLRWAWAPPLQGELARQGSLPTLVLAIDRHGAPAWYAYATGAARAIVAGAHLYVVRDIGISAYDGG